MKLKNLLFQPLTLNLSLDNKGLHLNAREVTDVLEQQLSDEIRLAAARGLVSLIGKVSDGIDSALDHALGVETASDVAANTTAVAESSAETAGDPQTNSKKGNRK